MTYKTNKVFHFEFLDCEVNKMCKGSSKMKRGWYSISLKGTSEYGSVRPFQCISMQE